ncbi:MAG: hypothetical protein ACR2QR_10350 [Woeseiaceae bacterium]
MKKYLRRHGDTFVKFHGPSVEDDWRHVNALMELTANTSRLRTAVPLSADQDQRRISYEWLGDLPRMITLTGAALADAIAIVGSGLAHIHEQGTACASLDGLGNSPMLPLESFGIEPTTVSKMESRLPIGLFHGDCWHGNVLVDDAGECVLIDPIQSPWLFGSKRYLLASGAVDLATMHMSLIVSFTLLRLMRNDLDEQIELGNVLLESYLQRFDALSLREDVLRLSRAIAIQYISSYPTRINVLVGWIKLLLSKKMIADVDAKLAW